MINKLKVCAAAVALLCASGAHADVSVRTSLGGLHATLIDLAPEDGIAPSMSFAPVAPATLEPGWRAYAGVRHHTEQGNAEQFVDETTNNLSVHAAKPGAAWADASLNARFDPARTGMAVAAGAQRSPTRSQSAEAVAKSDLIAFVLSPHTALTLSVTGSTHVALGDGSRDTFFDNNTLIGELVDARGFTLYSTYGQANFVSPSKGIAGPYALDEDFTVSLHLENLADSVAQGNTYFSSYVGGTALTAAPVPEPAGYALLAAGLGLLGWRARRRRHR